MCYQHRLTEGRKWRPGVSGLKESPLVFSCLLCHFQEIRNPDGAIPYCLFEIGWKANRIVFSWEDGDEGDKLSLHAYSEGWGCGKNRVVLGWGRREVPPSSQIPAVLEQRESGPSCCRQSSEGLVARVGRDQVRPAAFSTGSHWSRWPSPRCDPVPKEGAWQTSCPCRNKAA